MAAESRSVVLSSLPDDAWHLILSRLSLRDAGRLAVVSKDAHELISRLAKDLLRRITQHPYIRESGTHWLNRFVDPRDISYKPFGGHPQFLKIIYRIFQAVKNSHIITFGRYFSVNPEVILFSYQTFLDYLRFYRESSFPAAPLVSANAVPGNILSRNRVSISSAEPLAPSSAAPLAPSSAVPGGIFGLRRKPN